MAAESTEGDITRVPKPAPLTDEALRLQSRLWRVTYGSNALHINAENPLDVASWVSTLFAEHGQLLTSREPILEWPHYESTSPRRGMWIPYGYGSRLRVPPLLWLLMLDDTRCVTFLSEEPINDARRGPIMACLALMVREYGLSLEEKYVRIEQFDPFTGEPTAYCRRSIRPLSFLINSFEDTHSPIANLRALLTLGACPNTPVDYVVNECGEHVMKSALYYALTCSSPGLDAAQLLIDFGARLDPMLDGGIMFHAVQEKPSLWRYRRLMSLFERHRAALRGLENVHATLIRLDNRITTNISVFHELVRVYSKGTERQEHARLDSIAAMFRGLHLRVGVSLVMPGRCVSWDNDDNPAISALEYVRGLHEHSLKYGSKQDSVHLQKLIDVIEPLDRAERFSLRPLATAAELSLKRSPKFGGLTPELRRMVLRHVLAWAVQLPIAVAAVVAAGFDGAAVVDGAAVIQG